MSSRHLRRRDPVRGGEQVLLGRFTMPHETHQAHAPAWGNLISQLNGLAFTTPGISLLCFVADLDYDWRGIRDNADTRILDATEYRLGGRRYAIAANDLRREPPLEWVRNSVERILRRGQAPELRPADLEILDRTAFADAVIQALHDFHDDQSLARSPLLQSPMLKRHASRRDPQALRRLMVETSASQLSDRLRRCTLHEVLERIYFDPAAKQHAVAQLLHVSERTLRRCLREAENRLVEALWRLETGGE